MRKQRDRNVSNDDRFILDKFKIKLQIFVSRRIHRIYVCLLQESFKSSVTTNR